MSRKTLTLTICHEVTILMSCNRVIPFCVQLTEKHDKLKEEAKALLAEKPPVSLQSCSVFVMLGRKEESLPHKYTVSIPSARSMSYPFNNLPIHFA